MDDGRILDITITEKGKRLLESWLLELRDKQKLGTLTAEEKADLFDLESGSNKLRPTAQ
jgi:hypothetical protein